MSAKDNIGIIRAQIPASTGNADFTISGFGTPNAAMVIVGRNQTLNGSKAISGIGFGFTDGTDSVGIAGSADNAVATTSTRTNLMTKLFVLSDNASGTPDGEGQFDSWITDGIRINFTVVPGSGLQYYFLIILFKALNKKVLINQNLPSTADAYTDYSVGFKPNLVFGIYPNNADLANYTNQVLTHQKFSFGVAGQYGSTLTQGCMSFISADAQSSSFTWHKCSNDRFITSVEYDSYSAEITAFLSSAIRIYSRGENRSSDCALFALEMEGLDFQIKNHTLPTSTGNADFTGYHAQPVKGIVLFPGNTALATREYSAPCGHCGVYVFDGTNETMLSFRDEDAADPTDTETYADSKIKATNMDESDDYTGTFSSFLSTGFRINFTNVLSTGVKIIPLLVFETLAITPNGIASGGAFGSPTIIPDLSISPSSIASGQSFGSPDIDLQVRVSSIGSAEAWGSPDLRDVIWMLGISSEESWGSPDLDIEIRPSSIVSSEFFGTPDIDLQISISSISSGEAIGVLTLKYDQWITVGSNGISSEEAIGNPKVGLGIALGGIPSQEDFGLVYIIRGNINVSVNSIESSESFGSLSIVPGNIYVNANSIISSEGFGSPSLNLSVRPSSLPSLMVFGTPSVFPGSAFVSPNGIASGEALGEPSVIRDMYYINVNSILSGEAIGNPVVMRGTVIIEASSINPSESFGSPSIIPGSAFIQSNSILTGQIFGSPSITTGNINISTLGITTKESFGIPSIIVSGVSISASSISSAEFFGSLSLLPGNVNLSPYGIASSQSLGLLTVLRGGVDVSPNGIGSVESFGTVNISIGMVLNAIISSEGFGDPSISVGNVNIIPTGIISSEAIGSHIIRNVLVLDFTGKGIVSTEIMGSPTVSVIQKNSFMQLMETDLEEGFFNNEEFSENISYLYKDGTSFQLSVIFDHDTVMVNPDTGAEIISNSPMFICQSSDFIKSSDKGDKCIVRGVRYQVISSEPDGTGVTTIRLHHERTV